MQKMQAGTLWIQELARALEGEVVGIQMRSEARDV